MSEQFTDGHALIVGVGADLPCTINDAEELAKILTDDARCAYPSKQVRLLTSERANRGSVLSALDELAKVTDAKSTVVIFFSGHGREVATIHGESYYLMTYGYNKNHLSKTAINEMELTKSLKAIPAQKVLVLLDCCHAGGMVEMNEGEFVKSPIPPEVLNLLGKGTGYAFIASSQADEKSLCFPNSRCSAFTGALIEALCGHGKGVAKKDGFVRVGDLAMHTSSRVSQLTGDKQHPILHWEGDNFRIAYYAAGDPQPKELPFQLEPETISDLESNAAFDLRQQQVETEININLKEMHGGFFQPSWKVKEVTQVAGDYNNKSKK
jgi:uncharacterized caspase-like protein